MLSPHSTQVFVGNGASGLSWVGRVEYGIEAPTAREFIAVVRTPDGLQFFGKFDAQFGLSLMNKFISCTAVRMFGGHKAQRWSQAVANPSALNELSGVE